MKKTLVALILLVTPAANAASYFRFIDVNHVQQSAAFLFDPNGISGSVGVTNIALITHSTTDGTIVPLALQPYLPPENWAPIEIGGGGSFRADAVIDAGTSVNLAPQLGALVFARVDTSSPAWLQAAKAAAGNGGFRIGWAMAGNIVKGGIFQSAKEAFPGQGPLDVLKKGSRLMVGYSWTWGAKP